MEKNVCLRSAMLHLKIITGTIPFRIKCDRIESAGPSTSARTCVSTNEVMISDCTLTEFVLNFILHLSATTKRLYISTQHIATLLGATCCVRLN